ncbi:MAG: triose-phosphate isomerase [Verrucomicrobia bacterium]|nr:triose-phosphate isomerase [Verrucomicrobiota bacterium]
MTKRKTNPRRTLVAGNWKMHRTASDTRALIEDIVKKVERVAYADLVVCPPFTSLAAAHETLGRHSILALGAQTMHQAKEGAFTGEISGPMLREFGVRYVILGHSERRQFDNETNEKVAAKAIAAVHYHLRPIVCVGETLTQREAKETTAVVESQLRESLRGFPLEQFEELVIAYEPVWAIGTGKVATPAQANEVHEKIRKLLIQMFGDQGRGTRILYGGSVKPENAADLIAQPEIDGALVGGASLDARTFFDIIEAARPVRASEHD